MHPRKRSGVRLDDTTASVKFGPHKALVFPERFSAPLPPLRPKPQRKPGDERIYRTLHARTLEPRLTHKDEAAQNVFARELGLREPAAHFDARHLPHVAIEEARARLELSLADARRERHGDALGRAGKGVASRQRRVRLIVVKVKRGAQRQQQRHPRKKPHLERRANHGKVS
eukprot:3356814-Pleurochrysis_carterae.AAC.2